jgi:hypothetical protein
MLTGDENGILGGDESRPTRKSGQRKVKAEQEGKKPEPRRRKSAQRQEPLPDQLLEAAEKMTAEAAPVETTPVDASPIGVPLEEVSEEVSIDILPSEPSEQSAVVPAVSAVVPAVSAVVPAVSAEVGTVNYQTIANAYSDYARESLDRTKSFFDKLAGVRSLDKAFELQTEFAKQAYAGFIVESQKIRELHSQLAMQRLKHWEGLVARMINLR